MPATVVRPLPATGAARRAPARPRPGPPAEEPAALTLGQLLRRLRAQHDPAGATSMCEVERLTARVGHRVSHTWLSRMERDRVVLPSPATLQALARAYDVDPRLLLDKIGVRTERPATADRPMSEEYLLGAPTRAVLARAKRRLPAAAWERVEEAVRAVVGLLEAVPPA